MKLEYHSESCPLVKVSCDKCSFGVERGKLESHDCIKDSLEHISKQQTKLDKLSILRGLELLIPDCPDCLPEKIKFTLHRSSNMVKAGKKGPLCNICKQKRIHRQGFYL